MGLRILNPRYSSQFVSFRCNDGTPWAAEVEVIVRTRVTEALEAHNYADGVGWFDNDTLRGLAVWRYRPSLPATWHLAVLAVDLEAQGKRGLGQTLMTATRARARQSGIRTLTADVDARNERMLKIVEKFRGIVRLDPMEFYNRICTIPVR